MGQIVACSRGRSGPPGPFVGTVAHLAGLDRKDMTQGFFLGAEGVAGGLGDSPSKRPKGALPQRGVGEDQRCEEPRAV